MRTQRTYSDFEAWKIVRYKETLRKRQEYAKGKSQSLQSSRVCLCIPLVRSREEFKVCMHVHVLDSELVLDKVYKSN